jgi:type II secretory pathway pseudopilin PulG
MSKSFFLGSYFGLIALLASIGGAAGWAVHLSQSGDESASAIVAGLAALAFLFLVVFDIILYCLLIYKMWSAIQDGHARTTPGRAVGFLFIPFYGLYWIFVVFRGFALDYNALIERHHLNLPRLPAGLFTAFAVLNVITGIPYLGCLTALPLLIIFPILASKTCDAVNALPTLTMPAPEDMSREELVEAVKHRQPAGTPGWVWILVGIGGGFIVLAILGVIAAIAIPSLLTAKEAERLKTTQQDIRTIATAIETFLTDKSTLPAQAGPIEESGALITELTPVYLNTLPRRDAWGHDLLVFCGDACNGHYGISGCDVTDYLIVSLGKDGRREDWVFDPDDLGAGLYRRSTHDDFNRDLVFFNGLWIRAPQ